MESRGRSHRRRGRSALRSATVFAGGEHASSSWTAAIETFERPPPNFGLVWQSGKGIDMPAYQQLTRAAVADWREFQTELSELAEADLHYEQNGGLTVCLGEAEVRAAPSFPATPSQPIGRGKGIDWEMLDRTALDKLLPRVQFGPDVTGAGFGA